MSNYTCTCGRTLKGRQIPGHHVTCKPFRQFILQHQTEILEEALKMAPSAVANKYRIGLNLLRTIMYKAGLLKLDELDARMQYHVMHPVRESLSKAILDGAALLPLEQRGDKPASRPINVNEFLNSINEGTFWKRLVQSDYAGELMLAALLHLFERLKSADEARAQLKELVDGLTKEKVQLVQENETRAKDIRILRGQRDGALLKAAEGAFSTPGETGLNA